MNDPLSVLPLFHVLTVDDGDPSQIRVVGRFENCTLDADGITWFYLWLSATEAILPSLVELDKESGSAVISISPEDMRDTIRPGSALHWLDPYWREYHVTMILEGQWKRIDFIAEDAIHFEKGGKRGWAPLGATIPDGFVQTHIEKGGWDHEHCEICNSHIGSEGSAVGYKDENNRWLCPECHDKWAAPRSLGFLINL
jgi:hypothetical protein